MPSADLRRCDVALDRAPAGQLPKFGEPVAAGYIAARIPARRDVETVVGYKRSALLPPPCRWLGRSGGPNNCRSRVVSRTASARRDR